VLGQCSLDDLKLLASEVNAPPLSGNRSHKQAWVAALTAQVDAIGLDPLRKAATPLRFSLPGRARRPPAASALAEDLAPERPPLPSAEGSGAAETPALLPLPPPAPGALPAAAPLLPSAAALATVAAVRAAAAETRRAPRRSRFTDAGAPDAAYDPFAVAPEAKPKPKAEAKPKEPPAPPPGRQHGTVHRVKVTAH